MEFSPLYDEMTVKLEATCPWCHQTQPNDWDGGACSYCGGPMESRKDFQKSFIERLHRTERPEPPEPGVIYK